MRGAGHATAAVAYNAAAPVFLGRRCAASLSWAPGSATRSSWRQQGATPPSSGGSGGSRSSRGPKVRVTSEEISYSVVIESCSRRGDARGAAEWLEEMAESSSRPNVFAFNAVIASFARKGEAREAVSWLERMVKEGLAPNVVSYTAVIDGCAKAGDSEGAVRWFEIMLEKGIEPTALSYNAVINSCARLGDTEGAVQWLERMRLVIMPDTISYNSAISACANARPAPRADEAERLFREMRAAGLNSTASTLSALDKAIGVQRRDALCQALGVNVQKAAEHRPPPAHRKVRPLGAAPWDTKSAGG